MKRLVEQVESEGLESLLGETVTVFCMAYFYTGKLIGVNKDDVLLEDPKIIYLTGPWDTPDWEDAQTLPTKCLYVRTAAIESYGVLK